MRISWRRLLGALTPALLLAGCGGGGGGGGGISFTVAAINPAISDDLAGGDTVTITGTNFLAAGIANVTFGGMPASNRQVLSDTEMTVVTPAAPGGVPQAVTVAIISTNGGTEQLVGGYTYSMSGPNPSTIAPTTFTPTGAEDFTITGTSLGPLGGQVTVTFAGIGSVTGTVSANGQTVTGRAPVSAAVPPVGPITVTVDTGVATADVPTPVAYPFTAPAAVAAGVPGQFPGNASEPVRLADGFAVLCTSGTDATWGNGTDEIRILRGPPNAVQILSVSLRTNPGFPVGFLSQNNSIPAVLGPDTFCVYTAGGAAGPGYLLVSLARTTPVADFYPFPTINAAPIAAIGPNRIGFMAAGTLWVWDFNVALVPPAAIQAARVPLAGIADLTPGPANRSIPFTADGDTVFVMGTGANGVPGDGDDTFLAHVVSTTTTSALLTAPFLLGRPIPLSATLCAAPGLGPNGLAGGADDTLEVFSFTLAVGWARAPKQLGQTINIGPPVAPVAPVVPFARVGSGIALPVLGPNGIMIYTNPVAGTKSTLPFAGTPLLAPLGNGALAVFGPGSDLAFRTGDDEAILLDAAATSTQPYSLVPTQFQAIAALADADRAFTLSPGPDGAFQTADDTLEVYQSRSLAASRSASQLPASALPAARLLGTLPFVPVGPGWGVLQSPGSNQTWGDADDQLILVRY